jgi:hypothetical protein
MAYYFCNFVVRLFPSRFLFSYLVLPLVVEASDSQCRSLDQKPPGLGFEVLVELLVLVQFDRATVKWCLFGNAYDDGYQI